MEVVHFARLRVLQMTRVLPAPIVNSSAMALVHVYPMTVPAVVQIGPSNVVQSPNVLFQTRKAVVRASVVVALMD